MPRRGGDGTPAPARPVPPPPNTTFLATPFAIDALSALVADLLAKADAGYWSAQ